MKMIVSRLLAVADLHNKILDMHPFGPIFLLFMQFSANFGQIIRWLPRFRLAPREILDPPLAWPKGVSHVPSGGYLSRAVSVWGSLSREVSIEGGLSLGGGVSVQGSLCQGEDRAVCILLITARKRSLGQGNISSSVCQGFCLRGGVPGLSGCLVPGGGAWSRGGVWSRGLSGPGGCLGLGVSSLGGVWVEIPRDGYCCGRYTSYWNAFLFTRCGWLLVVTQWRI